MDKTYEEAYEHAQRLLNELGQDWYLKELGVLERLNKSYVWFALGFSSLEIRTVWEGYQATWANATSPPGIGSTISEALNASIPIVHG